MLEQQLKDASEAASKQRTKTALAGLAIVALALGGVVAVTSLSNPQSGGEPAAPVASHVQTPEQIDALRTEFKTLLIDFEGRVEARVASDAFAGWNLDAKHLILADKANAISLFSTGDYPTALQTLQSATALATSEFAAMDLAFDAALTTAGEHYTKDAHASAKVEITKALGLRPTDQNALALEAQIDALPRVLELVNAAQAARTENDLVREAQNLRVIMALAPNRSGLKKRLETVESRLRERNFAQLIKSGLAHVSTRNLGGAQSSLAAAQNLLPNRDELTVLRAQVKKLSETLKVEALIAQARQAAAHDDWAQALTLYGEAAKIEPNNKEIIQAVAAAQEIIRLGAQIDRHLNAPHRLGSKNVMTSAQGLVGESAKYFALSPALRAKSERLSGIIDGYAIKVALLVRSDNQTEVLVRGVGRVGQMEEKIIELKPGAYTFEGIRQGFKSRLVHVEVPPNATDLVVEVICNERL